MAKQRVDIVVAAKDQASKKLLGITRAAVGMTAAFFSWRAIKSAVTSTVSAYNQQEQAETKLQQALKATGGAAGFTFKQLKDYARQLQQTTEFGDEMTMEMMSLLATFKNVQGPVFTESTGLILDMSKAMNQDLKSTVIQVGKALNDPVKGITALSRVGVAFTEQQKNQIEQFVKTNDLASAQKIIMAELASEFGGQASAATSKFSGKLKQLANDLGDAKERFGALIANMPGFTNNIDIARLAVQNFGLTWNFILTDIELRMVQFANNLKFTFTQDIPRAFAFSGALIKRLSIKGGIDQLTGIWDMIKGDKEFSWKGLFGWEEMADVLKDIPREITDAEKELIARRAELEKELAKKLQEIIMPTLTPPTPGGGSGSGNSGSFFGQFKKGPAAVEARFLSGATRTIDYQKENAQNTKTMTQLMKELVKLAREQGKPARSTIENNLLRTGLAATRFM